MKNSLNHSENFINQFKISFPELNCEHHIEKISGNVNVFIMHFENEKELGIHWKEIRNLIAVHYQTNLEDEFERWNVYLVFVLPVIVHKELKYKIENDQLSSRKIVIDGFTNEWNDNIVSQLLTHYIHNKISLPDEEVVRVESRVYTSKSQVYQLIRKKGKSIKKRDKEYMKSLYNSILDKLRNEN